MILQNTQQFIEVCIKVKSTQFFYSIKTKQWLLKNQHGKSQISEYLKCHLNLLMHLFPGNFELQSETWL